MNHIEELFELLKTSLKENSFVKFSLGNYKGSIESLKNCYVKKILIKQEDKLSFTYRYQTKDIVKNYSIEEGIDILLDFISKGEFKHATLFTLTNDIIFEYLNKDKTTLRKSNPSQQQLPSLEHNLQKNRLISSGGKSYLHLLKITDEKGKVIPSSQDKYKQINHYVELLSPLIKNLPKRDTLNVLDMGAGKGYLTFALYDYLTQVLHLKAEVTGVEYRKDLVDLCNDIAKKSNFNDLHFTQGTIMDYDAHQANVLIALHACDTATDDAIFKGIKANADLIVVAPCCHKQIRREIEKHKTKNDLDFLLKHGIFLERQAEMLTDGLRSLILEYFDYSTKVFQFISEAHTPKNVMIVAEKKVKTEAQKKEILQKIKSSKEYFGIEYHQLEKLMEL
ncbi:MAG: SAM-dependent methyltransferase [Sphingobacteriaceae bacterium]|nr:SAM-dependent methyltransferase [Sphingobacteriaceae bacterium]